MVEKNQLPESFLQSLFKGEIFDACHISVARILTPNRLLLQYRIIYIFFIQLSTFLELRYMLLTQQASKISPIRGNTKGGSSCSVDLLFDWLGISSLTTDNFFLQNRLIQSGQTGGQGYSDTPPPPLVIPAFNLAFSA